MNDNSYMLKKPIMQKVLKKLIDDNGISARKVAIETGIPSSTLNSLLAGSGGTKPEHIYALAKYFDKTMEFLLYGEEEKPTNFQSIETEEIFEGWVKIKIEQVISMDEIIKIKK